MVGKCEGKEQRRNLNKNQRKKVLSEECRNLLYVKKGHVNSLFI